MSNLIDTLTETLPPIILRSKVGELTFGLVSPKSLSNADADGTGPAEASKLYGKVVYPRQRFIDWLEQQLFKTEENDNRKQKDGKNDQLPIR